MSLWTTKLLRHFLSTRCGVEYGRERVRQLLHALGVRQRRVRHRHLTANPQEHAAFVSDLPILLTDWPEDWALLFVDEATVRRHTTLSAMWCLSDDIPEVPTGDDHTKVHVYGAVAPRTGRTHYRISPTLSAGDFAIFLRQLRRSYQGKDVLIVHDRAEQHRGQVVDKVVHAAQRRLRLMPPPRYAPELNPQERLWKWLRRVVTHDHWCENLTEALQAIRDFFCYLAGRKDDVRQLCAIKTPGIFSCITAEAQIVLMILALSEMKGHVDGRDFNTDTLEKLEQYGPELKRLADIGIVETDESAVPLTHEEYFAVWCGARWRISAGSFVWWVAKHVIARTRVPVNFEDWLRDREYQGSLTRGQKEKLKALGENISQCIGTVAEYLRPLWKDILPGS